MMKNLINIGFLLAILALSFTACTSEKSKLDYNELNRQRMLEIAKKHGISEDNMEFNFTNNKLISEEEWIIFEETAKTTKAEFTQLSKVSKFYKAGKPFIDAHTAYLKKLNPQDIDAVEENKFLQKLQYENGKDLNDLLIFVKSKPEIFDNSLISELENKILSE